MSTEATGNTTAPAAGTTTTTAPTTTTTPPTTTTTPPTTTTTPWHGSSDQAVADYVKNKGWSGPADVIKSYQGAEKLIGRDPNTLISMPRADDPAGLRAVLGKLGLPESADKYEFAKPEGFEPDQAFLAHQRAAFHKAGLLPTQVKEITAAHNEYVKGVLKTQADTYRVTVEADRKALASEWGGGHERKMIAAQSAAKALGFSAEMIDAIERTVGYAGTWKFFADLGGRLSEDSFVSPAGGKPAFNTGMTPDEAKAQWEAMKGDPNIVKALKDSMHPNHEAQAKKQRALFAAMYPEKK